jgi:hypothetical protein
MDDWQGVDGVHRVADVGDGLRRLDGHVGTYSDHERYDSRQLTVDQIARAIGSSSSTIYKYLNVDNAT